MALLKDIVGHANQHLTVEDFSDYCPNGLQVEGKSEVKKIVSGVTASQALIDAAAQAEADLLLVHHGFFWRDESQPIVGFKKKRLSTLIKRDISLLAYHLPLDAHAILGNNAQLAGLLELEIFGLFGSKKQPVGVLSKPIKAISRQGFIAMLAQSLGRAPLLLTDGRERDYQTIALCTGAAQGYFEQAIEAGADIFITGEVSEQSYHLAIESGVDFCAAGHHATERYGVQALGDYLANRFKLMHEFIDIPNPV